MNIYEGTNIGSPNIFTGSDAGSSNVFTNNVTTIYPPEESPNPLFGRTTSEFGSTQAVFGED